MIMPSGSVAACLGHRQEVYSIDACFVDLKDILLLNSLKDRLAQIKSTERSK